MRGEEEGGGEEKGAGGKARKPSKCQTTGWSGLTVLPAVIEVKERQNSSAHDSVLVHKCCGSLH